MSTEENKAILRRIIEEALNKGNMALADELIATNYVFHGPGGQELKGPEGFKQFVTMGRKTFPDMRITIEDMVGEGDMVASRNTVRGTFKGEYMGIAPTGKQFTIETVSFHRFEGGKEVEVWESIDQLGMLQQVGVVPPMGQGGG